jgi:hypothetical protein
MRFIRLIRRPNDLPIASAVGDGGRVMLLVVDSCTGRFSLINFLAKGDSAGMIAVLPHNLQPSYREDNRQIE